MRPSREQWLRWLFLSLGGLLIFGHNFVINSLVRARHWSLVLYPGDFRRQALFLASANFALIPAGCLCLITAWGLKRDRSWTRLTGMIASVFLIFGIPWLTPFGIFCFVMLAMRSPVAGKKPAAEEFWDPNRQSLALLMVAAAGYIPVMAGRIFLLMAANVTPSRIPILPQLILIRWLYLPIHEFGHAAAACLMGFQIREIGIGPLVMTGGPEGWRFRFDWRRIVQGGGYVGSTPPAGRMIRLKQIGVIAGGPLASLTAGMAFGLAFFSTREPILALAAVMGVYDFFINLVPLGYTDGTMVFHLALHTRQGDALMARILSGSRAAAGELPDDGAGSDDARRRGACRRLEALADRLELAGRCAEAAAYRNVTTVAPQPPASAGASR